MTSLILPSRFHGVVQSRFRGRINLFCRIARLFINQYPSHLQVLEKAIQSADLAAIYSCAHRLKGSIAQIETEEAYYYAEQIEQAANEKYWSKIHVAYSNLMPRLSHLQKDLEAFLSHLEEAS